MSVHLCCFIHFLIWCQQAGSRQRSIICGRFLGYYTLPCFYRNWHRKDMYTGMKVQAVWFPAFLQQSGQVAAILLVLLFLAMVYSWRRKKSGSLWIYGYAVIDVIRFLRFCAAGKRHSQYGRKWKDVCRNLHTFPFWKKYIWGCKYRTHFCCAGQQYFPDRLGRACRIGRTENKKFDKNAAVICSGILYPWICTDPHRASVV